MKKVIQKTIIKNNWFQIEDLLLSIEQWGLTLTKENLEYWINKEYLKKNKKIKNVLVIMPGNIPIAGFHDFLCVLISGHNIIIKLSQKDNVMLPFLCNIIKQENITLKYRIKFTKNIFKEKYDCVIATGNNNTARYFEYYFRNKHLLLRKNRTSIGVLRGNENDEDLISLNKDILSYSGRGCRNVGKIFIPYKYNINSIFEKSFLYQNILKKNKKYMDNYKYYLSIYNMNRVNIKNNSFMIFLEKKNHYYSPISVIYYEYYKDLKKLRDNIMNDKKEYIQCIVSKNFLKGETSFGKTQYPKLDDYADGMNTIKFLS
ncbi:phosphoserine aminotransferase [Blattabacterium cuenoti]|uniref:phosphoserine aminotransferase n=1 Tax=Blattabacterium cuenoti TaxID=1653831 RepID=UPI001EEA8CDA|nr:phosphoserine aminotransferase [Blattabacterium cuenoti]